MIEKITNQNQIARHKLAEKINELIDAVNILQAQVAILEEHAHPTAKTEPADPYAEQRKWIGKVCRFFDSDKDDARIGVLSAIQNGMYFIKHTSTAYDYCEPIKPDDDIIYKGE